MYEQLYRACIRTAATWPRGSAKHQKFMAYARDYLRRIHFGGRLDFEQLPDLREGGL